jgi:hypothetical protein
VISVNRLYDERKKKVVMTYSELHIARLVGFHPFSRQNGILTTDHLDKSMAFLIVDNARLDHSILAKE